MTAEPPSIHGTAVALGTHAALLRGRSGAGKSDLALRFLHDGDTSQRRLVADDRVLLVRDGMYVSAKGPRSLAGKLEVRGVGIVDVPAVAAARLVLLVDLVAIDDVPRMPEPQTELVLGVAIPVMKLAAFEMSAAIKLSMALSRFG
jgi:HPr kinase/phosphorylase